MQYISIPGPCQLQDIESTPQAIAACGLYDAGLHVFPVVRASKKPYGPHDFLNTTRLWRPSLPSLVASSNIGVRTGRLSQNLFVLDCDSAEAYESVGKALQSRSISSWVRNGVDGGQYWLRCAEGEIANCKFGEIDVLGNRLYTLAPPSIHPSGTVYEWLSMEGTLPPVVSVQDIDFLPLRLQSTTHKAKNQKTSELPDVANRVIIERDASEYASNSEAEYAACMSLVNRGWSDEQILRIFKSFAPSHYSKVGDENFMNYVLSAARRRCDKYSGTSYSRVEKSSHSSVYRQWAMNHAWEGRTGAVDKVVFLALTERMRMGGGMPFRASIREVAEIANIDKMTAKRSMQRLLSASLIAQVSGEKKMHSAAKVNAAEYTISVDLKAVHTVGGTYNSVGDSVCTSCTSHDAWHTRALGKSAYDCWSALLLNQGSSVTQLGARTGRTRPTITKALALLEKYGLAQAAEGRWTAVVLTDVAMDAIAYDCNCLGKLSSRKASHTSERQRRATAIIEAQIASSPARPPR